MAAERCMDDIDMPQGAGILPQIYHQLGALTGEIKGLRTDMRDLKAAEEERRKRDLKLERRLSRLEATIAERGRVGFKDMDLKVKVVVAGSATGMLSLLLMIVLEAIKAWTQGGMP